MWWHVKVEIVLILPWQVAIPHAATAARQLEWERWKRASRWSASVVIASSRFWSDPFQSHLGTRKVRQQVVLQLETTGCRGNLTSQTGRVWPQRNGKCPVDIRHLCSDLWVPWWNSLWLNFYATPSEHKKFEQRHKLAGLLDETPSEQMLFTEFDDGSYQRFPVISISPPLTNNSNSIMRYQVAYCWAACGWRSASCLHPALVTRDSAFLRHPPRHEHRPSGRMK